MHFSQVRYTSSGVISTLLIKKADAGLLIPWQLNLLIRAVKTINLAVVGVEVLKHWQRLKVYGMFLEKYLEEEKIELLRKEVELATDI